MFGPRTDPSIHRPSTIVRIDANRVRRNLDDGRCNMTNFSLIFIFWISATSSSVLQEANSDGVQVDTSPRGIREFRAAKERLCKTGIASGCVFSFSGTKNGPLKLRSSTGTLSYGIFGDTESTIEESEERFRVDCERGFALGCFMHALLLDATRDSDDGDPRIRQGYATACKAGILSACNNLIVVDPPTNEVDAAKMVKYLKLACDDGDVAACENTRLVSRRFHLE